MFPPEVIDHILGFLQRDRHTLEVCADAHPSLSKLVERHLYQHVTVQNFGHPILGTYDQCDLLKRIVDNPNIANHVRSLRLDVAFCRDYHALESILPMVTQLRVIFLSSIAGIWDNLRESFRTAVTNCLRLPTLTHVELSNIDGFPLSALDHSSSLKGLSLWGDFSYLPPLSPPVYPPSDFLDLHCSSSSMEIITSWVESRSLPVRSLKLLDQSSRLLRVCANTLTTLMVCKRLPGTMHLLDTLPSPPTNLVLLVISAEITIIHYNAPDDISDMDWSPLISFPHFNVIPRVELRVQAEKSREYLPSVELLKTLKQDPHLMQLEVHESFLLNVVEKPVSWFENKFDI